MDRSRRESDYIPLTPASPEARLDEATERVRIAIREAYEALASLQAIGSEIAAEAGVLSRLSAEGPVAVSIREGAKLLGMQEDALRMHLNKGRIPSVRLGTRRLIRMDDLRQFGRSA